jgi:hypothetical protein
MPQFAPDIVAFGDFDGYGAFDIGHGREHEQFAQMLLVPNYPLLSFFTLPSDAQQQIIELHATAHELIRQATGLTGNDLSELDPQNEVAFNDWLNYHRQEHAQIRAALGLL